MTSQGMTLRNMALVGQTRAAPMPPAHKPIFEQGCAMVFQRWTTLQLGVQNEWGGASSKDKAQALLEDVIQWFYSQKDPEPFDLEELLDEALQVDFNIQSEDGGPYQVARTLTNMHNQVAAGDFSYVEQLRHLPGGAAAASRAEPGADGAAEDDSSSSDDEGSDSGSGAEGDAEGMELDEPTSGLALGQQQQQGPLVDEDGFQVVARKGGRRR